MQDYEIKSHRLVIDDKPVTWLPTVNKGGLIKPLYIVLHDTASPLTVEGDLGWLSGRTGNRGSSAHFVVDRAGSVTQLADCNVTTWHAGVSKWNGRQSCNNFTIGIEIDNPGLMSKDTTDLYRSYYGTIRDDDKVDFAYAETKAHGKGYWAFYTQSQIDTVVGMCSAMVRAYGCSEIITHYLISPGRKVDVNPLFPLDKVRERVFGLKDHAPIAVPAPVVLDATVTENALNLRSTPTMGSNIVGILNVGDRVDVQEADRVGNWLRVRLESGKGGYLWADFVRLDGAHSNGVIL